MHFVETFTLIGTVLFIWAVWRGIRTNEKDRNKNTTSPVWIDFSSIIRETRAYSIYITKSQSFYYEILLHCINPLGFREGEKLYVVKKMRLTHQLFSKISNASPNIESKLPLSNDESLKILKILISYGKLNKVEPVEYKGALYLWMLNDFERAEEQVKKVYEDCVFRLKCHDEVYIELCFANNKYQLKELLHNYQSNHWLPRKDWPD